MSSSFTVTPDTAPPSTGFVSYAGGYTSGSVTATTADGTDALSGVNAATGVLERDETVLVDGAAIRSPAPGAAVSSPDSTITTGHCYQYRYRVSDYVDNEAIYTSGNVVKVSTGAPGAPDLTIAETPESPNQYVVRHDPLLRPDRRQYRHVHRHGRRHRSGGSGVDKVSLPEPSGMTGGGDDTTSPYRASMTGPRAVPPRAPTPSASSTTPGSRARRASRSRRRGAADRPGRLDRGRLLHEPLRPGHPPERDRRALGRRPRFGHRRARVRNAFQRKRVPGAEPGRPSRYLRRATPPSLRTTATAIATSSPTGSATRPSHRPRAWPPRSTRRRRSRATTLPGPGRTRRSP